MGEGKGGMIWKNGIETCILSYVKQIVSSGLMHETGCLGLVHWDDPEGWDGEEGGSGVQDGGNAWALRADSCQYMGKNYHNIIFVLPYTDMNLPRVYMCSPS